jgi:ABC-type antimicrobial peptide transport system permease subunit
LALLLAATGVYGVVAYSVAQRTNEIGVRMAVGATSGQVATMVMREGAGLGVLGLILGLSGAYAVSGVLTRFLYGVAPTDGISFALAAACLLLVALVATYLPARRAMRVDPMVAVRAE